MSDMFKKNCCQSCYHSNYYFGLIFGIAYNNLQQQKEIYSQNNACTILVIIFWRSTMFYYRSDLPQVKRNLTSNVTNLVYGPLKSCLNLLQTQPSVQSFFYWKWLFKSTKIRYQSFQFFSNFTGFLCVVPNVFSRIV